MKLSSQRIGVDLVEELVIKLLMGERYICLMLGEQFLQIQESCNCWPVSKVYSSCKKMKEVYV